MPIKSLSQGAENLAFWALAGSFVASSFSNSFFEIFSGVFLALSLLLIVTEKRFDVFKSPFGAAVAIYLLVTLLSVTQSGYFAASLRGIFRVLRCALMSFSVIYLVNDEEKFKKVFYVFALSAVVIGLDALLQGFTGFEFLRNRPMTPYSSETARVTGPFHHANDFAAYLSMVIFIFLGMMPYALRIKSWPRSLDPGTSVGAAESPVISRKESALYFSGSLLLGTCLLWTYTRGAWLAVAVAGVLLAVLKRSRTLILTVFVAIALIVLLSPATLKGRITSLWNPKDGTTIERRELWDEALRMTHERPWLGYGINTYAKVEPGFKSRDFYTDNQYAHNGYLQIAAETGWVGLGSFLAVIICFFATTLRLNGARQNEFMPAAALSLIPGILSFLIHSATDTSLQSLRLVSLFWLAMGLVLAAKEILKKTIR